MPSTPFATYRARVGAVTVDAESYTYVNGDAENAVSNRVAVHAHQGAAVEADYFGEPVRQPFIVVSVRDRVSEPGVYESLSADVYLSVEQAYVLRNALDAALAERANEVYAEVTR